MYKILLLVPFMVIFILSIQQPLHDILADAVNKGDVADIALALKAMGNAGHPASLKTIMKLLPGFSSAAASLPVKVQVDAVMALRNIAKREQRKVCVVKHNLRRTSSHGSSVNFN